MNKSNVAIPVLSAGAQNILNRFFGEKMVALAERGAKRGRGDIVFTKQRNVKNLEFMVNKFIKTHPNAIVTVALASENPINVNDQDYSVRVRNFKHPEEGRKVQEYLLVVNSTWSEIKEYQYSYPDGTLVPLP